MSYWICMVQFARKNDWDMFGWTFGEMWTWPEQNAMMSHDERPWSFLSYSRMFTRLYRRYPDQIPF